MATMVFTLIANSLLDIGFLGKESMQESKGPLLLTAPPKSDIWVRLVVDNRQNGETRLFEGGRKP